MANTPAPARTFAALSMLEKTVPPLRFGREPYWRAPLPGAVAGKVYTPAWEWSKQLQPSAGTALLDLDINGAWLGAISSVEIAHNRLFHTGAIWFETKRDIIPGYYRITNFPWGLDASIVSPLGNSDALDADTLWIAHPTLIQLWELMDEGIGLHFDVVDSYTARNPETGHIHRCTFDKWYKQLKVYRTKFLDAVNAEHLFPDGAPANCTCQACADYAGFKTGYASAVSMMLTGEKCRTMRPDWAHAIRAEFAASCWRKAWRYGAAGRVVLAMADVDEITVIQDEFASAMKSTNRPVRWDQSGRSMGAFKVKRTYVYKPED